MVKIISHNERPNRPVLEYVLIAVVILLFVFGVWIYRQANTLGGADEADQADASITSGTPDEVDALTDEAIDTEVRLEESYDDEEQTSGQDVENAADALGNTYDETAY